MAQKEGNSILVRVAKLLRLSILPCVAVFISEFITPDFLTSLKKHFSMFVIFFLTE